MENEMKEDQIEGPPRKRLLTDPNPKESFVTASPESTVSSDSSSDRFAKKTRELPNLSDCHSCAVRINYTNPRERLQPLDSMWRVVLLCKKCIKRVKSSDLCPYCFTAVVVEDDCFKCRDCQHSIHKDCVAKYGSRLGFSVCVDCWVPDAIANSIRARKRKSRKKNKESYEQAVNLPESRVSVLETSEHNSLGGEVKRKVVVALKASENALRKTVVAKNAAELAKGVLNVVASRKVAKSCETKVVDDGKMACMLHRAINSSPRISRYDCLMSSCSRDDAPITCYSRRHGRKNTMLMNSNSFDVPLICYYRRHGKGSLRKSAYLDAPLMCYSRRRSSSKACSHDKECECFLCKLSERIDKHISISSACLTGSNCSSNSENILNSNILNSNGYQENDVGRIDAKPYRYLLKYHRIGKGRPRPSVFVRDSNSGYCMDSANVNTQDMSDTWTSGNGNRCHEICEKIDDNTNRFLLKYKRSRSDFSCKIEGLSPSLPSNHPNESRTSSDIRFQSSSQGEL